MSDKIKAADNISKAIKKGGMLSIYEPAIEVEKLNMHILSQCPTLSNKVIFRENAGDILSKIVEKLL